MIILLKYMILQYLGSQSVKSFGGSALLRPPFYYQFSCRVDKISQTMQNNRMNDITNKQSIIYTKRAQSVVRLQRMENRPSAS